MRFLTFFTYTILFSFFSFFTKLVNGCGINLFLYKRKCLIDENPHRGRTRGNTPKSKEIILSEKNLVRLQRLFKPYMLEFEEMIRSRKILV